MSQGFFNRLGSCFGSCFGGNQYHELIDISSPVLVPPLSHHDLPTATVLEPAALSTRLESCKNKKIKIFPAYDLFPISKARIPTPGTNQALQAYYKMSVTFNDNFFFLQLLPAESSATCLFLPYHENICTYVQCQDQAAVVVSGKFSGCIFVKSADNNNRNAYFGHVYVNNNTKDNNPESQMNSFCDITGINRTDLRGFKTVGKIVNGGTCGYVFAIYTSTWTYYWMECSLEDTIVSCRKILPTEWEELSEQMK